MSRDSKKKPSLIGEETGSSHGSSIPPNSTYLQFPGGPVRREALHPPRGLGSIYLSIVAIGHVHTLDHGVNTQT